MLWFTTVRVNINYKFKLETPFLRNNCGLVFCLSVIEVMYWNFLQSFVTRCIVWPGPNRAWKRSNLIQFNSISKSWYNDGTNVRSIKLWGLLLFWKFGCKLFYLHCPSFCREIFEWTANHIGLNICTFIVALEWHQNSKLLFYSNYGEKELFKNFL